MTGSAIKFYSIFNILKDNVKLIIDSRTVSNATNQQISFVETISKLLRAQRRSLTLAQANYYMTFTEDNIFVALTESGCVFCLSCSSKFCSANLLTRHLLSFSGTKNIELSAIQFLFISEEDRIKLDEYRKNPIIRNANLFPKPHFNISKSPYQEPIPLEGPVTCQFTFENISELIKNVTTNNSSPKTFRVPAAFDSSWYDNISHSAGELIIFGDCETQGHVQGGVNEPITFFCYNVNNTENIYLKIRPKVCRSSKYTIKIHQISDSHLQSVHTQSCIDAMKALRNWLEDQLQLLHVDKIRLYGNNVSTEARAILNNCADEDLEFFKNIKYYNTISLFKEIDAVTIDCGNLQSDRFTSPHTMITKPDCVDWKCSSTKSYSEAAISERFSLGTESHNALDDITVIICDDDLFEISNSLYIYRSVDETF